MKCWQISLLLVLPLIVVRSLAQQSYIKYVQPLSGTAPSTTKAALKHSEASSEQSANTIPSVTLPFAMTQWVCQTRTGETKCNAPYYYNDSLFTGIRGTHWISGSCMQDYGSVTVVPVSGKLTLNVKQYTQPFTHADEIATPAYYQLKAGKVLSSVTATKRCGIIQFKALETDSFYILIIPNSDYQKAFVKVDSNKQTVSGYNVAHRIYQGWGQAGRF